MPAPIAVQLYSLRDALGQDYDGIIQKVADIGFVGVETAGFPGTTRDHAVQRLQELGLTVPSGHFPLPIGDNRSEVLDTAHALGAKYVVSGGVGPQRFASLDLIKQVCDDFNAASAAATAEGLTFGIHTHWWEFELVDGQLPYQLMGELLDPAVIWEIDTYWVKAAGHDPVEILKELGARAPLLHIKDGLAVKDQPMLAVGQGVMDFHSIIPAHADHTEWLVVELDHCATDMLTAISESYRYLVGEGLARGKQS